MVYIRMHLHNISSFDSVAVGGRATLNALQYAWAPKPTGTV